MKILKAIYISSKEEAVSFRLQVINFQIRYGTKAAMEAYKISRATIFRWKKRLKESNFDVEALMDKSKVPKKKRKREVPEGIEDFIDYQNKNLDDHKLSNSNLIEYLIWFNTKKPHKSLKWSCTFKIPH